MTTTAPHIGLEAPPTRLALDGAALFLDLDGTLAPIVERPEDVRPDARRTALIDALNRGLSGRLAVVSGRSLGEIDHILEGRVVAVAGIHGLVRRNAQGVVEEAAPHPALIDAGVRLAAFAAQDPNLFIENKGQSLALHYRQAQTLGPEARALADEIATRTAE